MEVNGLGVYLYCFAHPGVVDQGGESFEVTGIDEQEPLRELAVQDVAAIFSRVPLEEFTGLAGEACLQDPAWLVPRACRHEQVVEAVMARSAVLPVRFGAVFSSPRALQEYLNGRCEQIAHFLDSMADKQEWAVKGFLNMDRAGQQLAAADPPLTEQRRRLSEALGARYFQEKRLQAEVRKKLKQWAGNLVEDLHQQLQSQTLNACCLPLQRSEEYGERRGVSPTCAAHEMVFNAAFLVPCSGVPGFRASVERLGAVHGDQGLALESSGPWPPYHFCPSLALPPSSLGGEA